MKARGMATLALAVVAGSVLAVFGQSATANHDQTFLPLFSDNPLLGGQVAPRLYRWVNNNVAIFVQTDRSKPPNIRFVGISVRGTFCSETQPDRAKGAFTHFHRLTAPTYASGHGGPPGTEGYWLMWVASDEFDQGASHLKPGVDYTFSPTPPPSCGASPSPTFQAPGAHVPSRAELRKLAAAFPDNPFRGGQKTPRVYRWVNGDVLVFLQFDKPTVAKATRVRYIGIAKRGTFCSSDRGTSDFQVFQRLTARSAAKGRGGKAGTPGFWHLFVATDDFVNGGRRVTPGVDRGMRATPGPNCPKAAAPGP